uniref:Uncharacterized protein n=1 Tax=Anguilla anguilla TaxID=7936 RepID=A0A0E9XFU0_ANGAN
MHYILINNVLISNALFCYYFCYFPRVSKLQYFCLINIQFMYCKERLKTDCDESNTKMCCPELDMVC